MRPPSLWRFRHFQLVCALLALSCNAQTDVTSTIPGAHDDGVSPRSIIAIEVSNSITDKDTTAIEIGVRLGIRHFALSFASSAGDVELMRALVPEGSTIISKIESRAGVRNRDEIIDASDAVLIDRGDLSREVPVEYVPYYQKAIVRQANRWNRPVYVATNLLESMVTKRQPTIAEMNDIANTLLDGVHGLVLAAETAMGVDPVGAVDAVMRCIKSFEHTSMGSLLEEDRLGRIG